VAVQIVDHYCSEYIARLYKNPPKSLFQRLGENGDKQTANAFAYGDITYLALNKICSYLNISPNDKLVDLGSGIGRTSIYFLLRTRIKEVQGFEINPLRLEFSQTIKNRVEEELRDFLIVNNKSISFQHTNFLNMEISDANHIFMDSTFFSLRTMVALRFKIIAAKNIKHIVTFKRIPNLKGFSDPCFFMAECSWGTAGCHIYTRKVAC
jgi:hypothetical protein